MSAIRLFPEGEDSPLTVAALAKTYLIYLDRRVLDKTLSLDHVGNIRLRLGQFVTFLGDDRTIRSCRQYDLTEWLQANKSWKSVCTKRNAINAVLSCFAWAEDEELIERSPYRQPRQLRGQAAEPRRPAEESEYQALIRGGSEPLRHALFFLWHTGARTCEMRNLIWDQCFLDCDLPHILIEPRLHKTGKRTGKPRIIVLDAGVVKLLRQIKEKAAKRYYKCKNVFLNCNHRPWDRHTFARNLRRVAQRVGLDDGVEDRVSAYCLRHSYACQALERGATTKEVADLLGHTDTGMVERVYGSHTARHLDYLSRAAEEIKRKRKEWRV